MKEEVSKFPSGICLSSKQKGCFRMLFTTMEKAKALEMGRPRFKSQLCHLLCD